jgi:hypothetical protein
MNSNSCLDNWEWEGYIYLVIPRLAHYAQVLGDSGCRGAFPVQKLSPLDSPPATIS